MIDIVSVLNEQDDHTKANNYWRWLKRKPKTENNQLVITTHGFKLVTVDGKRFINVSPNFLKSSWLNIQGIWERLAVHPSPIENPDPAMRYINVRVYGNTPLM